MFFNSLKSPIIGLSPMDGITDSSFRYIITKYSKPSIVYTEFISVDGFTRNPKKFKNALFFNKIERPIIVQFFGSSPDLFRKATQNILPFDFDGIDINMGCPDKSVIENGAGAALINNFFLASKIINSVFFELVKWKHKSGKHMSLSVKTRIGHNTKATIEWISNLCSTPLDFICVHGRTFKQGYSGQASWKEIQMAAYICHQKKKKILGNGDVQSFEDGKLKIKRYKVDGVLVGRKTLGNPWFFKPNNPKITIKDKISALIEHIEYGQKIMPKKPFFTYRKHIAWYLKDIPNASFIRAKCLETNSLLELKNLLCFKNEILRLV